MKYILGLFFVMAAACVLAQSPYVVNKNGAGTNTTLQQTLAVGLINPTTNVIHVQGISTHPDLNGYYFRSSDTNLTYPDIDPVTSCVEARWTNGAKWLLFMTNGGCDAAFTLGYEAGILDTGFVYAVSDPGLSPYSWKTITNQWHSLYSGGPGLVPSIESWFGTNEPALDVRGLVYADLSHATNFNGSKLQSNSIGTNQMDTSSDDAYRNPLYGETVFPTGTNTIPHRDWFFRSQPTPAIWYDTFVDFGVGANLTGAHMTNVIDQLAADGFVSAVSNAGSRLMLKIDDGWQGSNDAFGVLQPNFTNFPQGITAIVAYASSQGMDVGLYATLDSLSCGGKAPVLSSAVYTNVATWYKWGVRHVKIDDCNNSLANGNSGSILWRKTLNLFSDASVRVASQTTYTPTTKPIWFDYSIQNGKVPVFLPLESAAWEDGADFSSIADNISSVRFRLYFYDVTMGWAIGPGHTPKQASASWTTYGGAGQQTNHWMAAVFSASHLEFFGYPFTGSQITHYTNSTLLAVNQDPYMRPLLPVFTNASVEAFSRWIGPNIGQTNAVLMINASGSSQTPTFAMTNLNCEPGVPYDVLDAWTQTRVGKFVGSFSPGTLLNSTVKGYLFRRATTYNTNLTGGTFFTNYTAGSITVSGTISNVVANSAGASRHAIWVFAQGAATLEGTTNYFGDYHQAVTAVTNLGVLSAEVPMGYVVCYTNQATGANNDSKLLSPVQVRVRSLQ